MRQVKIFWNEVDVNAWLAVSSKAPGVRVERITPVSAGSMLCFVVEFIIVDTKPE